MHEIVDTSSPTFNEERRKGIGASEIAQACNLSSYGSAFELWERKTGRADPVATTIAMEIGNLLEGFLIEVFCREMAKTGQHWVEKGSYQQAKLRDKEHDWLWATLDTVVMCEGELCPLECKADNAIASNTSGDVTVYWGGATATTGEKVSAYNRGGDGQAVDALDWVHMIWSGDGFWEIIRSS